MPKLKIEGPMCFCCQGHLDLRRRYFGYVWVLECRRCRDGHREIIELEARPSQPISDTMKYVEGP